MTPLKPADYLDWSADPVLLLHHKAERPFIHELS